MGGGGGGGRSEAINVIHLPISLVAPSTHSQCRRL